MKKIFSYYKNRLIQITGRSRCLYSRNIVKKLSYDLGKLLESDFEQSEKFVNFLWNNDSKPFKFLKNENDPLIQKYLSKNNIKLDKTRFFKSEFNNINALMREVQEIEKETGRYELFIGYPFIEGYLNSETPIKAPLLFFPVKIKIENNVNIYIEVLRDQDVQINKALILAYIKDNNLKLEDFNVEFDSAEGLPSISKIIENLASVNIKIKYDPYMKGLLSFDKSFTLTNINELEVKNIAVLGRYNLANSTIYNDYSILEKDEFTTPAIEALINGTPIEFENDDNGELNTINQLDFAQEYAIEKMNKKGNLVIFGPPGTGKSQTIVNIISDALCKKKRILVVSQKKAALDVVFNRLGKLNNKVMVLTDADKGKAEFYKIIKLKHTEMEQFKPSYNKEKAESLKNNLNSEIKDLKTISDTLFEILPFGLTLQQMYEFSYNMGKNSKDYMIYEWLKVSKIMDLDYKELSTVIRVIQEREKDKHFYDYHIYYKDNPLIKNIKMDLDTHTIKHASNFINGLLEKGLTPFNTTQYPYSRYLLTYLLEETSKNKNSGENISLVPIANMINALENHKLVKKRNLYFIPPFTLLLPAVQKKLNKNKRKILDQLESAEVAVRRFIADYALLESVLTDKGLAIVIDSIVNGNVAHLKTLLNMLSDYVKIKDMRIGIENLNINEQLILDFALEKCSDYEDYMYIINNILPIRIYHETNKYEKTYERELSMINSFDTIRGRVLSLKKEIQAETINLAFDSFCMDYKNLFRDDVNSKNFLHQISKQNAFWPIRQLMSVFHEHLLNMYPCWLLSPDVVSTIFPLQRGLFDIILFDEASQVFIESAIPALYRAKAVAVSGDNKQLRPSSTFLKRYMGDDFSEMDLTTQVALEVESLLDLATSRFDSCNLTYHYRSKYEELINFSNYAFYDCKLQIAPNTSKPIYPPIERIKVNGTWVDRCNHEEAVAVVNLVKKILRTKNQGETIGIITFNVDQEEYIKDLFDIECSKDSAFAKLYLSETVRKDNGEDVSLFIKNLENVQGDERDIIIFSIGYAKNENGRIVSQFGSLSIIGGENRLNVAITRAKLKIYVVTSIEPEELPAVENFKNLGPKLLVKYLQYVRAVSRKDEKSVKLILSDMDNSSTVVNELSNMELNLKKELEEYGFCVHTSIGNAKYKINLALYDEEINMYVLGLECDNYAYYSSESILERDVYRINFLNSRGWIIYRVWSRDWWFNKSKVVEEIKILYKSRLMELKEKLSMQDSSANSNKKKAKIINYPSLEGTADA